VRILVVEDEAKVARALKEGLESEHYQVVVARTGEDGFFLANAETFDLVVLDLMLPGRAGLEILAACRRRGLLTPVLILTARDAIEDRVLGLDGGADDSWSSRSRLPSCWPGSGRFFAEDDPTRFSDSRRSTSRWTW
jgi:DNA-binding response OmpR family regulator